MRCLSRVLTCIAPMCQELPHLVIYQSRQSYCQESPLREAVRFCPPLTQPYYRPVTRDAPLRPRYRAVRPMAGGPSRPLAGPSRIQISPKRAKTLSLKSQLFGAMLYPSGSKKLRPIIFVYSSALSNSANSLTPTSISSVPTLTTQLSSN